MTIPNAEDNKKNGIGPDIWLAGDPEDLKDWMDKGVKGIVTNTVVLKDMTDKYGSIICRWWWFYVAHLNCFYFWV